MGRVAASACPMQRGNSARAPSFRIDGIISRTEEAHPLAGAVLDSGVGERLHCGGAKARRQNAEEQGIPWVFSPRLSPRLRGSAVRIYLTRKAQRQRRKRSAVRLGGRAKSVDRSVDAANRVFAPRSFSPASGERTFKRRTLVPSSC